MNDDEKRPAGPPLEQSGDDGDQVIPAGMRERMTARLRWWNQMARWGIRTLIGAVLFGWLAHRFPWGKYVLWTWIPLATLSLGGLLWTGWLLRRCRNETRKLLEASPTENEHADATD